MDGRADVDLDDICPTYFDPIGTGSEVAHETSLAPCCLLRGRYGCHRHFRDCFADRMDRKLKMADSHPSEIARPGAVYCAEVKFVVHGADVLVLQARAAFARIKWYVSRMN